MKSCLTALILDHRVDLKKGQNLVIVSSFLQLCVSVLGKSGNKGICGMRNVEIISANVVILAVITC